MWWPTCCRHSTPPRAAEHCAGHRFGHDRSRPRITNRGLALRMVVAAAPHQHVHGLPTQMAMAAMRMPAALQMAQAASQQAPVAPGPNHLADDRAGHQNGNRANDLAAEHDPVDVRCRPPGHPGSAYDKRTDRSGLQSEARAATLIGLGIGVAVVVDAGPATTTASHPHHWNDRHVRRAYWLADRRARGQPFANALEHLERAAVMSHFGNHDDLLCGAPTTGLGGTGSRRRGLSSHPAWQVSGDLVGPNDLDGALRRRVPGSPVSSMHTVL